MIDLGRTAVPQSDFEQYLRTLAARFSPDTYDLLTNNYGVKILIDDSPQLLGALSAAGFEGRDENISIKSLTNFSAQQGNKVGKRGSGAHGHEIGLQC